MKNQLSQAVESACQLDDFQLLAAAGPLLQKGKELDEKVKKFQESFKKSNHVLTISLKVNDVADGRFIESLKQRIIVEEKRVPFPPVKLTDSLIVTTVEHESHII